MHLSGTIYTTNREEFIEDGLPKIHSYIRKAKGVTIGDFVIEEIDLNAVPTVQKVRNGIEYTDLDWDWVRATYPANGNFSCLHISRKERDRIGLTHSNGRSKLGGRYDRNIGDHSMEFLVIANYLDDFIRLFLHELSHGFSHWSGVSDRTHVFEDSGNYIGDIYASYDFTKWNALKEIVTKLTAVKDALLSKKKSNNDTQPSMKNPEYLITHHGADARLLTLDEMFRIYQDTHFESLYKRYNQPRSSGEYPDIAYHILVGTDGWAYARNLDLEGYHASNYPVNMNSIAICISGNYDTQTLSPQMEMYYREAVATIRKQIPSLKYCNGHRAYSSKSCPGGTITDEFIKEVFDSAVVSPPNADAVKKHLSNALAEIQQAITNL